MSIPLVQKAEKDDINTSIIAIKRNIERINMLLGLSNSEEIDTSEFVKKSDIVDEVTSGNMQSVTSNAVAECLSYSGTEQKTGGTWVNGKPIYRKVIVSNVVGNEIINITSLNIDELIDVSGYIENDVTWIIPICYNDGTNKACAYWIKTKATLTIDTTARGKKVIILEYTKTTD